MRMGLCINQCSIEPYSFFVGCDSFVGQTIFSQKELWSNSNEGMDLLVRVRANRQKEQVSYSYVLYAGCPQNAD